MTNVPAFSILKELMSAEVMMDGFKRMVGMLRGCTPVREFFDFSEILHNQARIKK